MEVYAEQMFVEPALAPAARSSKAAEAQRSASAASRTVSAQTATSGWATTCSFLVPDAVAAVLLVVSLRLLASVTGHSVLAVSWLGPVMGLLIGSFAVAGLYHRALTMHPVQEIRTVGVLATVVFFAYGATLGLTDVAGPGVLVGLSIAGGLAVFLLALSRALGRILFAQANWWGAPVLVLASGTAGREIVRNLQRWPELGLRPVAVLQARGENGEAPPDDLGDEVPVLHETADLAPKLMAAYDIPYAIISRPDLQHRALTGLLRQCSRFCRQVFVMPPLAGAPALWTSQRALQGFLGYSVRHINCSRAAQIGKRVFDGAIALLALVLLAPLFLIVAVLVKLDSQGPVFFRQLRMGRRGRCFSILKFRSMHTDAEERLDNVLQTDPALRTEYETFHKLQDDPRVTRLGAVLRRFSLDELPQLWNVLKGDMSLAGPRAYTPGELSKMDGFDRVIFQCRPGLTGLWQVSGRNALSFRERTQMDVHYVHNWTPWLDLYVMARTIPVVCTGEGAA